MFNRRAGEGLGLAPDVVIYMGEAAQGMPQNEAMDQQVAQGFVNALGQALAQPQTMEKA